MSVVSTNFSQRDHVTALYHISEEKIREEVIGIVVKQFGLEDFTASVTPEKSFVEDLNADFVDLTELFMAFEEHFGFKISGEEAEKLETINDVIAHINEKKA